MQIRKYENTDKSGVIELLGLNTPQYFSPDEEEDLIYYLDNFADCYFIAEFDDNIIGCGGFNLAEDNVTAKISWDIIHPQFQGKGVGSRLLEFRMQKIKEIEGITAVSVRTSQLVFRFYEKFGFKLTETIKDYWADGFDMYKLERPLYL